MRRAPRGVRALLARDIRESKRSTAHTHRFTESHFTVSPTQNPQRPQAPRAHREARAAHHGARQSNTIAHSYTALAWPAARTSRDGHATAGGGCSLIVRLMSPESAREYAAGFWYRRQLRAQRSWLGLGLGSGSGLGLGLGLGLGFA